MNAPAPTRRKPVRVRLLEALMTLDDHRSIPDHSVEELAAFAGVAKGSVYYQFGSKDDLVRAMLAHGAGELNRILQGTPDDDDAGSDGSGGGAAAFHAQVRQAFQFLCDHPAFTGLVAFALAHRSDEKLREIKNGMVSLLGQRLQALHAAQAGLAPGGAEIAGVRAEVAATALLSAAVTLSVEHHTRGADWSIEQSVDTLVAMAEGAVVR